jgi:NodT family efflux transporter outer membrane factor (OMF) lipoprotein
MGGSPLTMGSGSIYTAMHPSNLARHRYPRLLGFLAMVFCAGCMIGPDYHRPPTTVQTSWLETSSSSVDTSHQQYRQWWGVFNDPLLTNLINLTYAHNLTVQAAGARVLEERAQLGEAIGELYPQQQTLGAGLNYNRLPVTLPFKLFNNQFWEDTFEVQAGWELDLWGKIRRGVQSADYNFLGSVANYDEVLVTTTGDVASTYVQIRTIQQQLQYARANVAVEQQSLEIAQARYQGGVVTQRDVDQAQNVLATTQAAIPQLQTELQQSQDAMAVLLGITPAAAADLVGANGAIPTAPLRAAVGIPADLLRRRPDLRQAELQAAAQCAQIGVAKADLLPALTLVGNLGTVATTVVGGSLDSAFNGQSVAWAAGPSLSWSILNYGQITNNVRYQDARFQELLIDYQNAVLKAQQEVEDGLASFVGARRQVFYLTRSVQAASDALAIANTQYAQGTVDFTTVLTAEQNLYSAQNSLAIADGAVPLGLIATYRALGGGWQLRMGHDFLPDQTRAEMTARTNWGGISRPQAPGLPGPGNQGGLVRAPEF